MANRFFISDHHLAHREIIQYWDRPFSNLAEMHDLLVTYHNEIVNPNDHVTFLGDVTMKRGGRLDREWFIAEMKRYHGHKRLALGNHDQFPMKVYLEAGFEKVYATSRDEQGLLFSHIPVHPRSLTTTKANVHGHIHGNPDFEPVIYTKENGERVIRPYINVSVEAIGYRPIAVEEIWQKIKEIQDATV